MSQIVTSYCQALKMNNCPFPSTNKRVCKRQKRHVICKSHSDFQPTRPFEFYRDLQIWLRRHGIEYEHDFVNLEHLFKINKRLFSKMAAENSNELKLKTYTSARKSTFTLVTLQSFSIAGVISAEKMKSKNEKFTDVCTPSHTNVCKCFKFHLTFPKLI